MAQYAQGVLLIDPDTGLPYKAAGGGGGSVAATSELVTQASDGQMLPLDRLAQRLGYTGDRLDYTEVDYVGVTYRQTLTYTGANLTAVSDWVAQ